MLPVLTTVIQFRKDNGYTRNWSKNTCVQICSPYYVWSFYVETQLEVRCFRHSEYSTSSPRIVNNPDKG